MDITAIPQDTLPLDMLFPDKRHYELCQQNPDMQFLVIYQPPNVFSDLNEVQNKLTGC